LNQLDQQTVIESAPHEQAAAAAKTDLDATGLSWTLRLRPEGSSSKSGRPSLPDGGRGRYHLDETSRHVVAQAAFPEIKGIFRNTQVPAKRGHGLSAGLLLCDSLPPLLTGGPTRLAHAHNVPIAAKRKKMRLAYRSQNLPLEGSINDVRKNIKQTEREFKRLESK